MNKIIIVILTAAIFIACSNESKKNEKIQNDLPVSYNYSQKFNKYWNAGKAELSSYELSKSRYGENHEGDAVLIFVTEPFLPGEQVKDDGYETSEKAEKVLKLIKTEKFFTGIYPYAIMTSTFHPLNTNREGLLKVSMSSQDWCGQVYSQLNYRGETGFELNRYSYFQKEGDIQIKIERGLLEEELFTQIRIDPSQLPIGNFKIYPSSKYFRLMHEEIRKYTAEAYIDSSIGKSDKYLYVLNYKDLDRKLEIEFENIFPYKITTWRETYMALSGKELTTHAKLKNNINIAYWEYNSNADSSYRKLLGL